VRGFFGSQPLGNGGSFGVVGNGVGLGSAHKGPRALGG
jgi:hypothetical protein